MNILVIENVNTTRGAAMSMRTLLKNLKSLYNVNITVMQTRENDNTTFYDDHGIDHFVGGQESFVIDPPQSNISWIKLRWRLAQRLRRVLKKNKSAYAAACTQVGLENIDIVYTNVDRYMIGHYMHQKAKIPHVIHLREFGDLDFGAISALPFHHKLLDGNVTKYIAISKAVKQHKAGFGIADDKIEVIYNGVENRFNENHAWKDQEKILRMAVVGAVIPAKGQLEVVQALTVLDEKIRDFVQLDIYGNGDQAYIQKIETAAKKAGVHVRLMGQTDHLAEILPTYHVGIVPSKAEAFGRVTVEYMMAGLYVIASDTGANPELISTQYGALYKLGSAPDLAEKITWAYEHREDAKRIADAGKAYASECFTDKINAEKVYKLFQSILLEKETVKR